MSRWFQVIPLDRAVAQLAAGTLPTRAAAITFDDGYADNATAALPVLKKHGMTATFFVASAFLDGGRMRNDSVIEAVRSYSGRVIDLREIGLGAHSLESDAQRGAAVNSLLGQIKYLDPLKRQEAVLAIETLAGSLLPDDLMMTSDQVRHLHREGMQIGAHTCSHPILANLSDEDARHKMRSGKIALEAVIADSVTLFAYPNGRPKKDYLAKHAEMAKQLGFSAAVTTAPGVSTANTDLFQMPRFSPGDKIPCVTESGCCRTYDLPRRKRREKRLSSLAALDQLAGQVRKISQERSRVSHRSDVVADLWPEKIRKEPRDLW